MALIFNPPPNWPKPPKGWKPTPTWRPDPAWGPVPAGWQLWIEEPTDSADFNDEGTAYEKPMDELPAHVGDDYTLAGDDSVIAPTPQEHAQHSPAAPATGSFPIQEQAGTERTVDTAVSHNAPAHSALEHDTVTAENSNGTEQGQEQKPRTTSFDPLNDDFRMAQATSHPSRAAHAAHYEAERARLQPNGPANTTEPQPGGHPQVVEGQSNGFNGGQAVAGMPENMPQPTSRRAAREQFMAQQAAQEAAEREAAERAAAQQAEQNTTDAKDEQASAASAAHTQPASESTSGPQVAEISEDTPRHAQPVSGEPTLPEPADFQRESTADSPAADELAESQVTADVEAHREADTPPSIPVGDAIKSELQKDEPAQATPAAGAGEQESTHAGSPEPVAAAPASLPETEKNQTDTVDSGDSRAARRAARDEEYAQASTEKGAAEQVSAEHISSEQTSPEQDTPAAETRTGATTAEELEQPEPVKNALRRFAQVREAQEMSASNEGAPGEHISIEVNENLDTQGLIKIQPKKKQPKDDAKPAQNTQGAAESTASAAEETDGAAQHTAKHAATSPAADEVQKEQADTGERQQRQGPTLSGAGADDIMPLPTPPEGIAVQEQKSDAATRTSADDIMGGDEPPKRRRRAAEAAEDDNAQPFVYEGERMLGASVEAPDITTASSVDTAANIPADAATIALSPLDDDEPFEPKETPSVQDAESTASEDEDALPSPVNSPLIEFHDTSAAAQHTTQDDEARAEGEEPSTEQPSQVKPRHAAKDTAEEAEDAPRESRRAEGRSAKDHSVEAHGTENTSAETDGAQEYGAQEYSVEARDAKAHEAGKHQQEAVSHTPEPEPGPQQEPYGLTDAAQQASGADEAAKPASILPAATFPEGTGAAQSHVAASETGKQSYTADPSGYGLSEEPTNQPTAPAAAPAASAGAGSDQASEAAAPAVPPILPEPINPELADHTSQIPLPNQQSAAPVNSANQGGAPAQGASYGTDPGAAQSPGYGQDDAQNYGQDYGFSGYGQDAAQGYGQDTAGTGYGYDPQSQPGAQPENPQAGQAQAGQQPPADQSQPSQTQGTGLTARDVQATPADGTQGNASGPVVNAPAPGTVTPASFAAENARNTQNNAQFNPANAAAPAAAAAGGAAAKKASGGAAGAVNTLREKLTANNGNQNFFATPLGLASIAGVILLVVLLILALVLFIPRGSDNTNNAGPAASSSSSSSSASSSSSSDSDDSTELKKPSGDFKEYTGEGKKTIDIEKPNGNDSKALVYYEFTPASVPANENNRGVLNVAGKTDKDQSSGFEVRDSGSVSSTITGSAWMDTTSKTTRKLQIEGEGKWTVRVYDASSAPKYGKGESIEGRARNYAFTYTGGTSSFEVNSESTDNNGYYHFRLDAVGKGSVIGTSMASSKSTTEWEDSSSEVYMFVEAPYARWRMNTK